MYVERLDRALSNISWRHMSLKAYVETLAHVHSDQAPILMTCGGKPLLRDDRPF